jgi:hypothetical protein
MRDRRCAAGERGASRGGRWSTSALSLSLALLVGVGQPGCAGAQELSLLAGAIRSDETAWPGSYAWLFSYRAPLSEHWSRTISYLNQGHFPGHHRDGYTAALWAQTALLNDKLTLTAGIGPFRYFDTTAASYGRGYSDTHGWGVVYSGEAIWRARRPWLYQLRLDRVQTPGNVDTTSLSLGVGYQLKPDAVGSEFAIGSSGSDPDEVTVFIGKTVVNSYNSQEARASGFAWRHRFGPAIRASIGLVNEGDAQLIRRNGGVLQGWLEPSFFADRFSVGIGGGVYVAIDKYRPTPGRHMSGIVTLTMSYRFTRQFDGRFAWSRIVTDYDRDTDVVLYGLGYRF